MLPLAIGPFIPHGHCYLWQPELVGLHVLSDTAIAIAYYSIPLTLLYLIQQRRDLPFTWVFWAFSLFIIACGTTHLLEVITLWYPIYWLSGSVKLLTGGISLFTAIHLIPLVNESLSQPSPALLEAANRRLESEIQERKHIEASLRQSESRYRAIVEDQTELICRFLPDGTFTFVNQAYCRYFGHTAEELVGHPYTPVVVEEDREAVQEQLQALTPDKPVTCITNRVILPDGSIRIQEWINRAIFNEGDRLMEFQAVGRDVTAMKDTEAALQQSQWFIQKLTDTAPVILYVYDLLAGHTVYVNRAVQSVLGYDLANYGTMESNLHTLMHPEDQWLWHTMKSRWQSMQEGDVKEVEFRLRRQDGTWCYLRSHETLFTRTDGGDPQQILGAAIDITPHIQTQQLQAALREKEVLLKEIHHRVKNNLQIIYSLLRLQHRQVTDRRAREVLLDSQSRIKSIALIHEKLYRSEDLAQVDLAQYIPNLAASLFSSYQVRPNAITLSTQIDPIFLDIDTAIPCGLIINELVTNALKYGFPNLDQGLIGIELCRLDPVMLRLRVSDNGIGLPADMDACNTKSLGLRLVRDLVEQLEGKMTIDRSQGTQFDITFPAERHDLSPTTTPYVTG